MNVPMLITGLILILLLALGLAVVARHSKERKIVAKRHDELMGRRG